MSKGWCPCFAVFAFSLILLCYLQNGTCDVVIIVQSSDEFSCAPTGLNIGTRLHPVYISIEFDTNSTPTLSRVRITPASSRLFASPLRPRRANAIPQLLPNFCGRRRT